MKKGLIITSLLILITSMVVLGLPSISYASNNFDTSTMGPTGEIIPTQLAYIPSEKISLSSDGSDDFKDLSSPEDMYFDEENDDIYVSDTVNKRIVRFSLDDNKTSFFGEDVLESPTGIYCNSENIFIADKGNKLLYVFAKDTFILSKTINRPTSPLLGSDTPYVPYKVVANNSGDIYLVSEGCSKGIMQLNMEGGFIGYIGANQTDRSFATFFANLFNIDTSSGTLNKGNAPTNLSIDSKGLIYTITTGGTNDAIKKLNTNGVSIMSPQLDKSNTIQACVDSSDNIYSVTSDGYVNIFDSYGNLLFSFISNKVEEVFGSLSSPVAIATKKDKSIYVLDKDYGMIIHYVPTPFASLVYKAVDYYKDGLYLEGEESWKEVLKSNSKFILAYKALARASMKRGDYNTALSQFKLAEDKDGYSEAYWQIRNNWLQTNLIYIIVPLIIVIAGVVAYKVVDKKKPAVFTSFHKGVASAREMVVLKDVSLMGRFYFHVRDGVYEIKYKGKGNIYFALGLYIWFIMLQIIAIFTKGYLFNSQDIYSSNGFEVILWTVLPLFGLVIANYFVASVTDGEGKFKDCFISFIYALTPYLVFALPIFILSNGLTYNESVVYNTLLYGVYAWCGINVFLTVSELHDYGFWKTILNVLLTIFALLMFALFIFVLYMLMNQLFGYVGSAIGEIGG